MIVCWIAIWRLSLLNKYVYVFIQILLLIIFLNSIKWSICAISFFVFESYFESMFIFTMWGRILFQITRRIWRTILCLAHLRCKRSIFLRALIIVPLYEWFIKLLGLFMGALRPTHKDIVQLYNCFPRLFFLVIVNAETSFTFHRYFLTGVHWKYFLAYLFNLRRLRGLWRGLVIGLVQC